MFSALPPYQNRGDIERYSTQECWSGIQGEHTFYDSTSLYYMIAEFECIFLMLAFILQHNFLLRLMGTVCDL